MGNDHDGSPESTQRAHIIESIDSEMARYGRPRPWTLAHAVSLGMPDMVALCLEKGADIHETENLRTALEIALLGGCSKNGSIECVDLLIEAGAKDLEQAAMHAIHCGVPNMRDFILSKMQDRKFLIEIDEPVVCSSEETL